MAEGARRAGPVGRSDRSPHGRRGRGDRRGPRRGHVGRLPRGDRLRPARRAGRRLASACSATATTAVLEMASASGLSLIARGGPRPASEPARGAPANSSWPPSTPGPRAIILGIGGSATNDGGAGFAQAIGFRLLDRDGQRLAARAAVRSLASIGSTPKPSTRAWRGPRSSWPATSTTRSAVPEAPRRSSVPQKGADPAMIAVLDRNLAHLAVIVARDLGAKSADIPGSGAAGGLGGGLIAFAEATLEPGVDVVARAVDLEAKIRAPTSSSPARGRSTPPARAERRPSASPGSPGRWASPRSGSPARSGPGPSTFSIKA